MTTSVRQLAESVEVFMLDPGAEGAWVLECVPVTVYGAARTSIRLIARILFFYAGLVVVVVVVVGVEDVEVGAGHSFQQP